MEYTLTNGKKIKIPEAEIEHHMKSLKISREEAISLWLDDHDYTVNEEQNLLDEKAKKVKISREAKAENAEKKPRKPKTVKISDEKHQFFEDLVGFLAENGYDYNVLTENKLINVKIGEKMLKIDIIEQRKPKK